MVIAAKEAGIRIVGIDTTVSYLAGTTDKKGLTDEGSADRYRAMNFAATSIMRAEAGNGKYIALMGEANVGSTEGVPVVADMLGVPSVVVADSDKIVAPQLAVNVSNYQAAVKQVGALLTLPSVGQMNQMKG